MARPSNKRPSDGDEATEKKRKQDVKDDQVAKSLSMTVPVDEHSDLKSTHKVHIDEDDNTIYDVTLNLSNAANNNNKFYRLQLLVSKVSQTDFFTYTRWGRVGEKGQSKTLGDGTIDSAFVAFSKKFKEKTGLQWEARKESPQKGKYTFIERMYEDRSNEEDSKLPGLEKRRTSGQSAKPIENKLPGPVKRLMELIFNQQYFDNTMTAFDYDADRMPLGRLSKRTLMAGYEKLKLLADKLNDPLSGQYVATFREMLVVGSFNMADSDSSSVQAVQDLSNDYLSIIPHVVPRHSRPPVISTMEMVKREIEMLESLADMQLATGIMKTSKSNDEEIHILDGRFRQLKMQEMTPLKPKTAEFQEINAYLQNSTGHTHGFEYKTHDIFRIERQGENDRFAESPYSDITNSDRRLLWHGSRSTNYGGILSQGLRIAPPEAPVSGYMSSKSANYCFSEDSGDVDLLLLCEAELGKPSLRLTDADSKAGEPATEAGCISTWGVGRTVPTGWKDASCVHPSLKGVKMPDMSAPPGEAKYNENETVRLEYNEYILYDGAQVKLRYLLRTEILQKWD